MATETAFRSAIRDPAIFHLAMHSVTDTVNSNYSWLAFDTDSDTVEDGRLYNYEISLIRIKSPMVVLSACNSGTGTLYHSEGLMSMARSFTLAGASSVVRTSWEVNDETSAGIIINFYHYLSRGMKKDEALRQAKIDYLEGSPPSYSDPRYWAAYEVLGDNSPVRRRDFKIIAMVLATVVFACVIVFYFKRRRIFPARSE
jgi:CHAT domain-containing protein